MSVYLIAKKDVDDLQAAVFYAGETGNEEAVAAFTSADIAREYIDAADWSETETVAELKPLDFLQWLGTVYASGTRFLAVNPIRMVQETGIAQPVLRIEDQLAELASLLIKKLDSPAPPPPMELQRIEVFHCEKCGEMVRQQASQLVPLCCGQDMQKPVVETVSTPRSGDVLCAEADEPIRSNP